MSDHAPEQAEQRSSVKLTLNAKHEPQFEVKVYIGDDPGAIEDARAVALENFLALCEATGVANPAA